MSDEFALTDVIVELHVPDFETAKDFYGKLGFEKVWEYPPHEQTGYLVMRRDKSILAFFCGNDEVYNHEYFKKYPKTTPRGYGVEITIHIVDENLELYYAKVIEKIDAKYVVQSLKTQPWGTKDFRLVDPFGYYLSIRENDKILVP